MNYWGIFFMTTIVVMPLIAVYLLRDELEEKEKSTKVAATTK